MLLTELALLIIIITITFLFSLFLLGWQRVLYEFTKWWESTEGDFLFVQCLGWGNYNEHTRAHQKVLETCKCDLRHFWLDLVQSKKKFLLLSFFGFSSDIKLRLSFNFSFSVPHEVILFGSRTEYLWKNSHLQYSERK